VIYFDTLLKLVATGSKSGRMKSSTLIRIAARKGAFLIWFALVFTYAPASWACKCADSPSGLCADLLKDNVAFLGTVDEVERISASSLTPSADGANSGSTAPANAAPVTRYHFHIDENFAGADFGDVDIFSGGEDGDCGYRFEKGRRYAVFTRKKDDGRFFATICNGTKPASAAQALIPQLRALRDGRRVASVFGILRRVNPPLLSPPDAPEDALPNVAVKLRSKDDRFSTSTGADGVYSIYDVHAGEYQFSADLPGNMDLGEKAQEPFTIPNGACYEYDVSAVPTGRIRGSVVGPDGKPLPLASVELYRLGDYKNLRTGLWRSQGSNGFFDYNNVGPGEYILVFNRPNHTSPDSPFPRAFYPGVADPAQAESIKLEDGQQLLNVNIRVENSPISDLRPSDQVSPGAGERPK
jgi:hypothetical protein